MRSTTHFRSRVPRARWAKVRLLALDVDGVLTDGTVQISSDGSESKSFSILDGMGLKRLATAGITVAWISGRPSRATTARASELNIPHLIQGHTDKLTVLRELADRLGLKAEQVAYMGDDDIDAPAIAWSGVGVSVPGAMPAAVAAARYITCRHPGHGAVREVCEQILAARVRT
ncbi:MAG: HAD hydrolase family protein [Verrucomicrobia bacterium]|nr:HAD hydrolase family protein [Verrucomicrobiota bacterium]